MPPNPYQPPGTEKCRDARPDRRIWRKLLLVCAIALGVAMIALAAFTFNAVLSSEQRREAEALKYTPNK